MNRELIRRHRLWLATAVVDAIGTGFITPITVLYFTLDRGFSAVDVGIGLSVAGAAGIAAPSIGGALSDRFGARSVTAALYLASGVAFLLYLTVGRYWQFVAVVVLAQVSERMVRPPKSALVAQLAEGSERLRLLAIQRALRNAGFGVGGAIAALALVSGSHRTYVLLIAGDALSYLAAAALVTRLRVAPALVAAIDDASRITYRHVLGAYRYLALAGLNMVMLLHASVLEVAMPLWVTRSVAAPRSLAPALFTVNTMLVVGLQVLATRASESVAGAARAYVWATALLVGTCAVFACAAHVATTGAIVLLVLAIGLLSVGEVLATAGEWGVSWGLAPDAARGRYLAVFATTTAAQSAFGPAVVTVLVFSLGTGGWLVLAALFGAAGLGASVIAQAASRG